QVLDTFFSYLGVKKDIPVSRMGQDGIIDRYLFNTPNTRPRQFDLPEGIDAFEENLLQSFPEDRKCIRHAVSGIRDTSAQLHNLDLLFATENDFSLLDQTKPYGEILAGLGCSPGLRSVLAMASSWIGVPVEDCPVYYHNMALASYLSSSWRLETSGTAMADVFTNRFQELGGTVRCNAEICSITVRNRVVQGVELCSGEQTAADIVIAAVHPQVVLKMLPDGAVKPSYKNRIQRLQNTHSIFSLHASVDAEVHPEIPYNIFNVDTDATGNVTNLKYYQIRRSDRRGKSLLSILTSGHDELWQPWQNSKSGRRGGDYRALKRKYAEQLLQESTGVLGEFSGLKLLDVATPLTMRDWLNSPEGSAYGVLRSASQTLATAMLNRTAVKGLCLAGQNVLAPGIIGTIMGSFSTVKLILGPEEFLQRIQLR
ncbi:MAG: hypothetical protein DSY80_07315, partial [Desulfocapsa sp.]